MGGRWNNALAEEDRRYMRGHCFGSSTCPCDRCNLPEEYKKWRIDGYVTHPQQPGVGIQISITVEAEVAIDGDEDAQAMDAIPESYELTDESEQTLKRVGVQPYPFMRRAIQECDFEADIIERIYA
ncbi:hypothetical protein CFL01nite_12270 [Corynebacterium flavescens]|uniref:Enolase C-terminal domain-containing protein n=2 Tax=Corynebacterium flavescens TaxID=28028 RepID=A0AB73B7N2_CORFL|nr:hypothetical protein [Corynebacterium flavescens]GEB97732.1 hypothetical protein CFL01nite_12270 [Corynebacterium flavescens]